MGSHSLMPTITSGKENEAIDRAISSWRPKRRYHRPEDTTHSAAGDGRSLRMTRWIAWCESMWMGGETGRSFPNDELRSKHSLPANSARPRGDRGRADCRAGGSGACGAAFLQ